HGGAQLPGGLRTDLAVRRRTDLRLQGLDVAAGERAVLARAHPALQRTGGGRAELAVHHERAGGASAIVPGGGVVAGAGIGGGTTVGLGQARALAADGPGAGPLALEHTLGDGDLLALGGLVGVGGEFLAAEALPGGLVELEAAVVAVAGVDRPVAAGLALGDLVPDAGVRLGDAGSGGAQARCHHGAAGGGGHLRGDPCAAEVDRGAVGAMGGDSSRCGHRHLLGKGGEGEAGNGGRASSWADVEMSATTHGACTTSTFGILDANSAPIFEETFTEYAEFENDIDGITEYKSVHLHRASRAGAGGIPIRSSGALLVLALHGLGGLAGAGGGGVRGGAGRRRADPLQRPVPLRGAGPVLHRHRSGRRGGQHLPAGGQRGRRARRDPLRAALRGHRAGRCREQPLRDRGRSAAAGAARDGVRPAPSRPGAAAHPGAVPAGHEAAGRRRARRARAGRDRPVGGAVSRSSPASRSPVSRSPVGRGPVSPLRSALFPALPLARVRVLRVLVHAFVAIDVLTISRDVLSHPANTGFYTPVALARLLQLPPVTAPIAYTLLALILVGCAAGIAGWRPRLSGAVVAVAFWLWML